MAGTMVKSIQFALKDVINSLYALHNIAFIVNDNPLGVYVINIDYFDRDTDCIINVGGKNATITFENATSAHGVHNAFETLGSNFVLMPTEWNQPVLFKIEFDEEIELDKIQFNSSYIESDSFRCGADTVVVTVNDSLDMTFNNCVEKDENTYALLPATEPETPNTPETNPEPEEGDNENDESQETNQPTPNPDDNGEQTEPSEEDNSGEGEQGDEQPGGPSGGTGTDDNGDAGSNDGDEDGGHGDSGSDQSGSEVDVPVDKPGGDEIPENPSGEQDEGEEGEDETPTEPSQPESPEPKPEEETDPNSDENLPEGEEELPKPDPEPGITPENPEENGDEEGDGEDEEENPPETPETPEQPEDGTGEEEDNKDPNPEPDPEENTEENGDEDGDGDKDPENNDGTTDGETQDSESDNPEEPEVTPNPEEGSDEEGDGDEEDEKDPNHEPETPEQPEEGGDEENDPEVPDTPVTPPEDDNGDEEPPHVRPPSQFILTKLSNLTKVVKPYHGIRCDIQKLDDEYSLLSIEHPFNQKCQEIPRYVDYGDPLQIIALKSERISSLRDKIDEKEYVARKYYQHNQDTYIAFYGKRCEVQFSDTVLRNFGSEDKKYKPVRVLTVTGEFETDNLKRSMRAHVPQLNNDGSFSEIVLYIGRETKIDTGYFVNGIPLGFKDLADLVPFIKFAFPWKLANGIETPKVKFIFKFVLDT